VTWATDIVERMPHQSSQWHCPDCFTTTVTHCSHVIGRRW